MRLTVQAEFRHPFDSDLGAGHCKVPDDPAPMRVNDCDASAFTDCDALDNALLDSLRNSDGDKSDSDFCRALRNGADVNVFGDGDYPMALAATLNRIDIGKILLRDGATIHSDEAERGDALNYAAYAGGGGVCAMADCDRWRGRQRAKRLRNDSDFSCANFGDGEFADCRGGQRKLCRRNIAPPHHAAGRDVERLRFGHFGRGFASGN